MMFVADAKTHLFHDWRGRKQKIRNGRLVDNTLCASNHGMSSLLTTEDPQRVTCKRCLRAMHDSRTAETLFQHGKDLAAAESLLGVYRQRVARLERTLVFALQQLEERQHVIIHLPTDFSIGDLVAAVLADKVKETD